jgi:DNA-binding MarR family transcriptional regulator
MEHRGLVGREGCTDDRRGAFIVLTDAGRRAIEAAAHGHVDAVRRLFFDGLTHDQITVLGQLSTQVLDRLDASAEAVT